MTIQEQLKKGEKYSLMLPLVENGFLKSWTSVGEYRGSAVHFPKRSSSFQTHVFLTRQEMYFFMEGDIYEVKDPSSDRLVLSPSSGCGLSKERISKIQSGIKEPQESNRIWNYDKNLIRILEEIGEIEK